MRKNKWCILTSPFPTFVLLLLINKYNLTHNKMQRLNIIIYKLLSGFAVISFLPPVTAIVQA